MIEYPVLYVQEFRVEGVEGNSKWSQFCHLGLYGKCLYVVFTY